MLYEEKEKLTARPHNVILEDRTRLSVSGVIDVETQDWLYLAKFNSKGQSNITEANYSDFFIH